MEKTGRNYKLSSHVNISETGRDTLHDKLSLTGCEVSLNELPAGASVPFVHAHKNNEEVYIVLEGSGVIYVDGEEIALEKGSIMRIDPDAARCIKAGDDSAIRFICIQAESGSLTQFTEEDGYMVEVKPSWLA